MVERVQDERGIPHTTMRDGAPNGYSIITFDGAKATFDFKASRFPANHQLRIHAPVALAAADVAKTSVYVNVFAGSEKSTVKLRVNGGKWTPLKKRSSRIHITCNCTPRKNSPGVTRAEPRA